MPLALDPNRTFDLVLESDAEKPPEKRPVFVCRFLTGREWKRVAAMQDSIDADMTGVDALTRLFEAIAVGIVGWRNMIGLDGREIPFAIEDLDLLLNPTEAAGLVGQMLAQTDVTGDDRKKSESPSQPASENSAAADAPGATGPPK